MPFKLIPIGEFGAVVEELDLSELADAHTISRLRRTLATFQLLLFRGQAISPHEQLRLRSISVTWSLESPADQISIRLKDTLIS